MLCMPACLVHVHIFATVVVAVKVTSFSYTSRSPTQQKGRVVEQGTHATLKAQGGLYAHLLQTYKEGIIDA